MILVAESLKGIRNRDIMKMILVCFIFHWDKKNNILKVSGLQSRVHEWKIIHHNYFKRSLYIYRKMKLCNIYYVNFTYIDNYWYHYTKMTLGPLSIYAQFYLKLKKIFLLLRVYDKVWRPLFESIDIEPLKICRPLEMTIWKSFCFYHIVQINETRN